MSAARLVLAVLALLLGCRVYAASVTPWQPSHISTAQFESHPAFDPRNGDLYFVRSSRDFIGWRILVSRCGEQGWSVAKAPPFAGDGQEADPWFTPDGRRLYFISSRTTDGVARKDLDIWYVDRDDGGHWATPQRLPEPVNTTGAEWFPRLSADGWLYFGSNRPGGLGKTDLWRARVAAGGSWTVENLGPAVNSAGDEYEPLLSPDDRRMVLMADGGLYQSHREGTGWSPRVKLGPEVNVNGSEIGAAFSPDGKAMLFARDTKGPQSGELFVLREADAADWPAACPARVTAERGW